MHLGVNTTIVLSTLIIVNNNQVIANTAAMPLWEETGDQKTNGQKPCSSLITMHILSMLITKDSQELHCESLIIYQLVLATNRVIVTIKYSDIRLL